MAAVHPAAAIAIVLASFACGVRAPAPIDVAALVAKRGPVEARRDLEIRVLADPRDVQARLALAKLADQSGRPAEAIDELEAVERPGGSPRTRRQGRERLQRRRVVASARR